MSTSNNPDVIQAKKSIIANKSGPIIIIEDDAEDQELLTEIFKNLNYPNKVVFFLMDRKLLILSMIQMILLFLSYPILICLSLTGLL
jgi:hypothetical protein